MTMYEVHTPLPPAGSARETAAERFELPSRARIARERFTTARTDPRTLPPAVQENWPATVEYLDAMHARVFSELGVDHSNCQLLIARLIHRGYTVSTRKAA